MRPRLSEREAKFILDSLKRDKAAVQEKLARALISEGLTAKKQELTQLEAEFLKTPNRPRF